MMLLRKILQYRVFQVSGSSMSPSFSPNSFVLGKKNNQFSFNDVVISTKKRTIKRVFGVSGNLVHLCGDNSSNSSEHILNKSEIDYLVVWPRR